MSHTPKPIRKKKKALKIAFKKGGVYFYPGTKVVEGIIAKDDAGYSVVYSGQVTISPKVGSKIHSYSEDRNDRER